MRCMSGASAQAQSPARTFCATKQHGNYAHNLRCDSRAHAAGPSNSSASSQEPEVSEPRKEANGLRYSYHSDGHYKATIEDVFGGMDAAQLQQGSAPWQMGWQANERNMMWNDDLKMRLLVKLAAQDGSTSESEIRARLDDLIALLPGIEARLPSLKPEIILRLAKDTDAVAHKLLQLKGVFPGADCGKMLVKEMGLMSESVESLSRRASALRDFLPAADIDAIAQEHPSILSVDSFKKAVEDARRLMPGADIENMLLTDPDFVLSLQKGTDMIPYDAVPDNPWGHK